MTKTLLNKGILLVTFLEDKHISFEELIVLVQEMNKIKNKNKSKKDLTALTPHIWLLHGIKKERKDDMQKRTFLGGRKG